MTMAIQIRKQEKTLEEIDNNFTRIFHENAALKIDIERAEEILGITEDDYKNNE